MVVRLADFFLVALVAVYFASAMVHSRKPDKAAARRLRAAERGFLRSRPAVLTTPSRVARLRSMDKGMAATDLFDKINGFHAHDAWRAAALAKPRMPRQEFDRCELQRKSANAAKHGGAPLAPVPAKPLHVSWADAWGSDEDEEVSNDLSKKVDNGGGILAFFEADGLADKGGTSDAGSSGGGESEPNPDAEKDSWESLEASPSCSSLGIERDAKKDPGEGLAASELSPEAPEFVPTHSSLLGDDELEQYANCARYSSYAFEILALRELVASQNATIALLVSRLESVPTFAPAGPPAWGEEWPHLSRGQVEDMDLSIKQLEAETQVLRKLVEGERETVHGMVKAASIWTAQTVTDRVIERIEQSLPGIVELMISRRWPSQPVASAPSGSRSKQTEMSCNDFWHLAREIRWSRPHLREPARPPLMLCSCEAISSPRPEGGGPTTTFGAATRCSTSPPDGAPAGRL
mmetsp:Transcript_89294/g.216589  ORF Transcript_89294/g.216589 Transcript_89294/m.216589 type:complete len:464 (+) Transcript_89294:77-1468(+)